MKPYAEVIGDPVAHSKSPLIHKFWLRKLGLEGDYRAVRVTPEELPDYLASRLHDPNWRGCNVTMPLKETAWKLVGNIDPSTRRIGAINTILNHEGVLFGTNTDWQGINIALGTGPIHDWSVVIIGAGGGARAAVEEMRQAKPARLTILNRSPARAQAMIDSFRIQAGIGAISGAPSANLLINATPLGMEGFPPLEIGLERMAAGGIIFDMVYRPLDTQLLQEARSRGLKAVDGLSMLIHQAAKAFTLFFHETPEPADIPELRAMLAS